MGLLKLVLVCIDFLAWPVIALGYPLFASIRAIETGSKYHMRKLVTYWALFSLISLFEFAFVKIIGWIPFWSYIKLVAILWLLMPRFDGACHAYQRLIRPCLSVDLEELIDKVYRPKEEKPRKSIKENGSEALENLISRKECTEPDISHRDTRVLERDEKNATAALEQVQNGESISVAWVIDQEEKDAAAAAAVAEVKAEMTTPMPDASADNRHPETTPPMEKVEQQWICDLCQVKTTSEKTLNAHLQGSKHKSKCESLKTSKLYAAAAQGTGSPTLDKPDDAAVKSKRSHRKSCKKTEERVQMCDQQKQQKRDGCANQTFKLWCDMCNVKLLSEIDLASHLRGKRHLSRCREVIGVGSSTLLGNSSKTPNKYVN